MPEYQFNPRNCQTHGSIRTLRRAYDSDESGMVGLPQALRERDGPYYCPGCGIEVYPVRSTNIVAEYKDRRAHFRRVRLDSARISTERPENLAEMVKNAMVSGLRETGDFDYVDRNVEFSSDIFRRCDEERGGRGWGRFKDYTLDIVARRGGPDSIDIVLHVVDLTHPANTLYQKAKQIADEQQRSRKRKYIQQDGQRQELALQVYQNFLIIANEHTYREAGRNHVELVPTIHNFLGDLTTAGEDPKRLMFFDPVSVQPFTLTLLDQGTSIPSDAEHDSRLVFRAERYDLPFFTMQRGPEWYFERETVNRGHSDEEGHVVRPISVKIPKWKLAVPVEIEFNDEGKRVTPGRPPEQMDLGL